MLPQSLILVAALANPTAAPVRSSLVMPVCKFADTYQFDSAKCTLEFRNSSEHPIVISELTPGSRNDAVYPSTVVVPAKGTAYAEAIISPTYEVGRIRRIFRFRSNEPNQLDSRRSAEASGFVAHVLDEPKPVLDFGVVNLGNKATEHSIRLESREVAQFRIERILETPPYVSARIGGDGQSIVAKIKSDAPWGLHKSEFIRLAVNTPNQREVWVQVHADVHGDIVPSSNPFSLGLFRRGSRNEFSIRLSSRDGKEFSIGKVDATGLLGESTIEPCVPASQGCKLLRYVVSDAQPSGQISAVVNVELPEFKRTLPISAWGMYVEKDTKVRDFNEEMKEAEAAGTGAAASPAGTVPALDLKQALVAKGKDTDAAPPPGRGPLLKWNVIHEGLIHGYAVYRASSEAGPYVRVNERTIPIQSNGDDGSSYHWRDTSAAPGAVYWYYIGTINNNGSKEKLSSPQKVVAK